jgi:hypothetical protein
VHLDEDQHRRLGEALAVAVLELLPGEQHKIP